MTRRGWLSLEFVTLAATITQAFGRFTYALFLPAIVHDLLHSYVVAGFVSAAHLVTYLLGALIVSAASHRISPVTLMRGGLAAGTVGLVLAARAQSTGELTVALILTGAGGAFVWIPAPGLAAVFVPPSRRGAAMGAAQAGIGGGIALAGVLAALLPASGADTPWRTAYVIQATIGIVAVVLCFGFLRAPQTLGPVLPTSSGTLRRVPGWMALVAGFAAQGLAVSLYTSFLVAALQTGAGLSQARASTVYTLIGFTLLGGGVALGSLSDRWGRGRALVLGYLLMAGAIGLSLGGGGVFPTISALVFGLMMSGVPAVVAAYLGDVVPPREFPAAFGRCTVALGVMQLCGPPLGGLLAEASGSFALPFVVAALGALGGAVVSAVGLPRMRSEPPPAVTG